MRARTSSVSSTSCFAAVVIVGRLETMKSASLPGSAMFSASVCRSSDSSGDSDTTCWKFVLMLRCSASISRRSSSRLISSASSTSAIRYGLTSTSRLSGTRTRPWTISRRLPSGSLNILWMCVAVPIAEEVFLGGLFDRRVTLGEDGDQPAAGHRLVDEAHRGLPRDGERHERIRKEHRVAERQDGQLSGM